MAAILTVYEDVGRVAKLAEEASNENYSAGSDLNDQAERLADIAEIAGRASDALYALNNALETE